MEKRFFETTSALWKKNVVLALIFLIIGCNKISKRSDDDISIIEKYKNEVLAINDTLQKLVKFSGVDLLVLRHSELENYDMISIENRCLPVKIVHDFKIEKRGKTYLILEGKAKLSKIPTDSLSKKLIKDGLITLILIRTISRSILI